ncbi:ATP-dependent RNA helicase ddx42 [Entophlyctis luteolus]|nr:ATP-dependent RNA helicase ddx42 [Entophlyctis luteolus]
MKRSFHRNNDDDDDDEPWARPRRPPPGALNRSIPPSNGPPIPAAAVGDDEEDPLDAFMKTNAIVAAQPQKPKAEAQTRDDEEDYVESYAKALKAKGIEIGTAEIKERGNDYDSDEEVYATARALESGPSRDDFGSAEPGKKDIDPLGHVDHSAISYIEIEKDLLRIHPDIEALSDAEVTRIRRELDMRVSGNSIAKPCISFAHFMFEDALLSCIAKAGYSTPTPIQQQAVPVSLNGRDLIAVSKTGSGKTAAFLWPMIVHMMDQPELERGDGPIGLVLAPTRELASQIHVEAKKFGKAYSLKSAVVYGGASKTEQFKELRGGGVEILVATPGRLIDLVKMKALNLKRVSFLVLDEADRMFDLGFEPQVRSICNAIRPDRQTLLFSATFAKKVERLARDVLNDPVRITIGNVGQSNTDVEQTVVVLHDDGYKWDWLTSRLRSFAEEGTVMIFIGKKAGVDELSENLTKSGFACSAFHGDLMQHEREKVLSDLKAQRVKILVATDVAARGLDIKSVRTVVNYDVARDIDNHVHRCGRTGRAGEKGKAFTLITQQEDRFAADLVQNFEESMLPVPPELLSIAMKNARFRSMRSSGGGGRGVWRGGRGGRGGRGRGGTSRGGIGSRGGFAGSGANQAPLGQGTRTALAAGGIRFQKSNGGSDWKSTSLQ